jgi:thiol-disulfide isomerase/thioredoxin
MKASHSVLALVGALTVVTGPASAADPIADCRPVDMATGQPLDLTAFRGQVLYVDFWASWCVPCRKTFPFMNALHEDLADAGLHILAISLDDNREDAQGFLDKFPADFQVALDSTSTCPVAFQVLGMPSSYVVGRDGGILHTHMGFQESDADELRALVSEALQ